VSQGAGDPQEPDRETARPRERPSLPDPALPDPALSDPGAAGLCPRCAYVKRLRSDRGSTFLLCARSKDDPRFPKYPPQPVLACDGFVV
jgi:hypothetical protein